MKNLLARASAAAFTTSLLLGATQASAATTEYIVNGDFEQTTVELSTDHSTYYRGNQIAGWNHPGYLGAGGRYDTIFVPGSADSSVKKGGDTMWGPNNGSNNGYADSPTGGNYIGLDGDASLRGALSQLVTGLTIGESYTLSFWWAAGQYYGFSGPTTSKFQVTFGDEVQTTEVLRVANHGFEAWRQVEMIFTATGVDQLLSFLAIGTPSGLPPVALLDGVSLTETYDAPAPVPLPAALPLLAGGVAGLAVLRRKRRQA